MSEGKSCLFSSFMLPISSVRFSHILDVCMCVNELMRGDHHPSDPPVDCPARFGSARSSCCCPIAGRCFCFNEFTGFDPAEGNRCTYLSVLNETHAQQEWQWREWDGAIRNSWIMDCVNRRNRFDVYGYMAIAVVGLLVDCVGALMVRSL